MTVDGLTEALTVGSVAAGVLARTIADLVERLRGHKTLRQVIRQELQPLQKRVEKLELKTGLTRVVHQHHQHQGA